MRGDRADHPDVVADVIAGGGGKKITVVVVDKIIINNYHCIAETTGTSVDMMMGKREVIMAH